MLRALRVAVGVVGVMQVEVRTFAQQQAEFISLVGHVALEALLARRRHEQLGELVRRNGRAATGHCGQGYPPRPAITPRMAGRAMTRAARPAWGRKRVFRLGLVVHYALSPAKFIQDSPS
ncbi:hypothetical protein D3C87_1391410 [compost metagenome]